jgi:hypothetical protein
MHILSQVEWENQGGDTVKSIIYAVYVWLEFKYLPDFYVVSYSVAEFDYFSRQTQKISAEELFHV